MGCAALVHAWALCHLPHRGPSAPERLGPHPLAYFLILRRIKLEWWDASRVMDPVHRPPQDLGSRPCRVPVGCFGRMCISQHAPHGPTPLGNSPWPKLRRGSTRPRGPSACPYQPCLGSPAHHRVSMRRSESAQARPAHVLCVLPAFKSFAQRQIVSLRLNATNISSSCGTPAAGL